GRPRNKERGLLAADGGPKGGNDAGLPARAPEPRRGAQELGGVRRRSRVEESEGRLRDECRRSADDEDRLAVPRADRLLPDEVGVQEGEERSGEPDLAD